jgi:hypothetical protein
VELRELLPRLPSALAARPELRGLAHLLGDASVEARAAYRGTLGKNLLLLRALDRALAALCAADVPVQPLKGALFLDTLYGGDLGARPMADLDLLVPEPRLGNAEGALLALGYRSFGDGHARFGPRFTHHRILVRQQLPIELHFRLCHELAVDGDPRRFFCDTRVIDFRGQPLAVARDELQLYFVLLHAATHALAGSAVWLIDALLLARTCSIDWRTVEQVAREQGALRPVRAAARRVNTFFPSTFPDLPAPRDPRDWLLDRLPPKFGEPPDGRSLALRLLLTERARDAAWLLGHKLELRAREAIETVRESVRAGARPDSSR